MRVALGDTRFVRFSPCGRFLATVHPDCIRVRVLDSNESHAFRIRHVRGLVFLPGGETLVIKMSAGDIVAISLAGKWDGSRVLLAGSEEGPVPVFVEEDCCFDGDGVGGMRLVCVEGGVRRVAEFPGEMIKDIMVCGPSSVLVVHIPKCSERYSKERPAYFTRWVLPISGSSPHIIRTGLLALNACACSSDGLLAAVGTAGADRQVYVLQLGSGDILARIAIAGADRFVKRLRWVGDKCIAVVADRVIVFNTDLKEVGALELPFAMGVDVSPDGHLIALASSKDGLLAPTGSLLE